VGIEAAVIIGVNVIALVLHYVGTDRRITRLETKLDILWNGHKGQP
jgi:hypothetical protein